METIAQTSTPKHTLMQIAQIGGLTILIAVVLNVILFFIADAAGVWDGVELQNGEEMVAPAVAFITILGLVGGIITFAALNQFTQNPVRIFQIVAGVVLVLSFVTPFGVEDAPADFIIALELMHVVAGVTIIALFSRLKPTA